jgi:hypothetical protein
MKRTTIVVAAGLALAVTLPAVSVQAQAIRTFVSTAGTDNPSCSITSPCRHFSAAMAATAPGGEVDALDAGAYGSFTITQAISIEGQGWSYVAPPSGGAAITINAATSDKINIRGVSLNGVGVTAANTTGIQFNTGASLNVQNSVIRNFEAFGIYFHPNSSTPSQLSVSNTLVSDNVSHGIELISNGSGTTTGVLDHVEMENNGNDGLNVQGSPTINVTVHDSVSANNGGNGINVATGGALVSVMVRNSTIANNGANGLFAQNIGSTIRVTRSTITGNNTGWAAPFGGIVLSYGDNNIDGNGSANTAPPNPLVYH